MANRGVPDGVDDIIFVGISDKRRQIVGENFSGDNLLYNSKSVDASIRFNGGEHIHSASKYISNNVDGIDFVNMGISQQGDNINYFAKSFSGNGGNLLINSGYQLNGATLSDFYTQ